MELRQYFLVLRRRWWLFVLGPLVAAVAAFAISKHMTPIYRAQAKLLVNVAPQALPSYSDVIASQQLTKSYALIVSAGPTLDESATKLGGGVTANDLRKVSAADVAGTSAIYVTFEDKDPDFAARVVNTVADVTAEKVRTLQLGGNSSQAPPNINTVANVDPAVTPRTPVSPRVALNTVLAGIVGLLLSIAAIATLEYLDDTVKDETGLTKLDLTLMGSVHRYSVPKGTPLSLLQPHANARALAEEYRQLRTNIQFAALDGELTSLAITSPQPAEGKTTTACNLAIILARTGRQVILVDADLRRPSVHTFFGLRNRDGLTTALFSPASKVESLLQLTPIKSLRVLTPGPLPPNPSELLGSAKMEALVGTLKQLADFVVFDSPPSNAIADAAILSAWTDAMLVVVDAGHTRLSSVRVTLDHLSRSHTRLLGAVLNKSHERSGRSGYYYYYYSSKKDEQGGGQEDTTEVPAINGSHAGDAAGAANGARPADESAQRVP